MPGGLPVGALSPAPVGGKEPCLDNTANGKIAPDRSQTGSLPKTETGLTPLSLSVIALPEP